MEDMAGRLQRQVAEHGDWLRANCDRQVRRLLAVSLALSLSSGLQVCRPSVASCLHFQNFAAAAPVNCRAGRVSALSRLQDAKILQRRHGGLPLCARRVPLCPSPQVNNYREFAEQRAAQLGRSFDSLLTGVVPSDAGPACG